MSPSSTVSSKNEPTGGRDDPLGDDFATFASGVDNPGNDAAAMATSAPSWRSSAAARSRRRRALGASRLPPRSQRRSASSSLDAPETRDPDGDRVRLRSDSSSSPSPVSPKVRRRARRASSSSSKRAARPRRSGSSTASRSKSRGQPLQAEVGETPEDRPARPFGVVGAPAVTPRLSSGGRSRSARTTSAGPTTSMRAWSAAPRAVSAAAARSVGGGSFAGAPCTTLPSDGAPDRRRASATRSPWPGGRSSTV
mmetsp:Transcript_23030/g.79231  ORF Transcript_23030/g.79231 Transcript_23030/m.79231 type:complete len:253 (+) Transcript_23030:234-992(+)